MRLHVNSCPNCRWERRELVKYVATYTVQLINYPTSGRVSDSFQRTSSSLSSRFLAKRSSMQAPPRWSKALARHPWYRLVMVSLLRDRRRDGEEWGERGRRGISFQCTFDHSDDLDVVTLISIFFIRCTRQKA